MAPTNEYMTLCGTDEWMAPEVMLGEKYDEKADVYSFGMVLVEIITREKPFERATASSPYDYDKLKNLTPPTCPYELFKICILCSQFYPINRPTIFEAQENLRNLYEALQEGPVKTVSDIQAEMARQAALEAEERSSGKSFCVCVCVFCVFYVSLFVKKMTMIMLAALMMVLQLAILAMTSRLRMKPTTNA